VVSDAVLVRDLSKEYTQGPTTLEVLKGVDVRVGKGEIVCVMGPSGSGKSTLLNLVGGLDAPTRGEIEVGGKMVTEMSDEELADFRRHSVGFVFQSFNLVSTLTAKQNVEMPLVFAGVPAKERSEKATWVLEQVGLADRMHHVPSELSGGEQQRVATARATTTPRSSWRTSRPATWTRRRVPRYCA
jgi:putative ABC transport system ATP-binding protein